MPATNHFPESGVRAKNKGTLCPGVLTGFDVSFSSLPYPYYPGIHLLGGDRRREEKEEMPIMSCVSGG